VTIRGVQIFATSPEMHKPYGFPGCWHLIVLWLTL